MSQENGIRVAILMGSDSDLPVMAGAVKILEKLGIGYRVEITSAHRSPERTVRVVQDAVQDGAQVFIVGAGSAAHLAGVVAAHTILPVLGVPLASSDLRGLDALLSTVQMPAGIPVGTLAVGKAGAANAAWLAAAILAVADPDVARDLEQHRKDQAQAVAAKSARAQESLSKLLES